MPVPLLSAYMRMLPRLSAEEALDDAERVAVGAGTMKSTERSATIRRWSQAMHPDKPATTRPSSAAAHRALAAAAGIGVRPARAKG